MSNTTAPEVRREVEPEAKGPGAEPIVAGRATRVLTIIGPGLAMAATGVGAGDLMAAMLSGADFGLALAWAIAVGAVLKLALNEGVARWQLETGTSLLEGWCRHLGRPFQLFFLVYLVLWSFTVGGGLMSACGVAAHAVVPQLSIALWAAVHSLLALGLVLLGRYGLFEGVMKTLVAVMVLTLVGSVVLLGPDLAGLARGLLVPTLPRGSAGSLLGLMGGVGGSVTLLSYGYWIREKGWRGRERLADARLDLGLGYSLTGLFGIAMLVLAAQALGRGGGMPAGSAGLVACADAIRDASVARLGARMAEMLRMVFLVGVWGAVASSILGVWQGVPYLFADYVSALRGSSAPVSVRSLSYRSFLLYLAIPPMLLLILERPIWVIRVYTVTAGLFMPFLAASLLWMNSRRALLGGGRNGAAANTALVVALLLFVAIAIRSLVDL